MATIAQSPFTTAAQKNGAQDIPTVDSSFLENFKYDAETKQLVVTMKNGAQYLHFGVEQQTVEGLIKAPSKGKFYANVIKKSGSPATKVTHKEIGPANRNPLKGPVKHEQRKQPSHYRS